MQRSKPRGTHLQGVAGPAPSSPGAAQVSSFCGASRPFSACLCVAFPWSGSQAPTGSTAGCLWSHSNPLAALQGVLFLGSICGSALLQRACLSHLPHPGLPRLTPHFHVLLQRHLFCPWLGVPCLAENCLPWEASPPPPPGLGHSLTVPSARGPRKATEEGVTDEDQGGLTLPDQGPHNQRS